MTRLLPLILDLTIYLALIATIVMLRHRQLNITPLLNILKGNIYYVS